MKKRLRNRKKIRGGRCVFRTIDIDGILDRLLNPIPPQGITVTLELDEDDKETMRTNNGETKN